jgi:hypothetical protein
MASLLLFKKAKFKCTALGLFAAVRKRGRTGVRFQVSGIRAPRLRDIGDVRKGTKSERDCGAFLNAET